MGFFNYKFCVPPIYDDIIFGRGLAFVRFKKDGQLGYIDKDLNWTEDNCLWQSPSCPVPESIVSRVKQKLGEDIPVEAIAKGKYFRKYVANRLAGVQGPIKKIIDSIPYIAEIALANLLDSIGVDMMAQPFIWKPPFDNIGLAAVNKKKVKILKLDAKKHLVPGSEMLVEL